MKLNIFVIPIITIAVAVSGGVVTSGGMEWYKTLQLPSFTPSGGIIGAVWTVIFILSAMSAVIFYNVARRSARFWWTVVVFLLNAVLNFLWSYIFFGMHNIGASVVEAGVLGLSVIALIVLIWKESLQSGRNMAVLRWSSILLFPYAAWVVFATYLAYSVALLNA